LQLSILVLGQCGTGKSTFINSLCDKNIIPPNIRVPTKLFFEQHNEIIFDGGTNIELDITVAKGFGDLIDNSSSLSKTIEFIDSQFEKTLNEECKIKRNIKTKDTRIHVVLYFIRPTGNGLRVTDIEIMKAIGLRCNLIPVISKADLLTEKEKTLNKKIIMNDVKENNINIYDFSMCFNDLDDVKERNDCSMPLLPFAIVSGSEKKIIGDVEHKVRQVAHGIIKIDDPEHSDFIILRTCLLGACLEDLREKTFNIFYENYRTNKLSNTNIFNIINNSGVDTPN
jgi:cell division control protein 11/sporulation-regulated protein 28